MMIKQTLLLLHIMIFNNQKTQLDIIVKHVITLFYVETL